ncbi:hypothetical protein [Rickettsiales endosymbiont of Stachyamoeba lipophora]|uniref:hypothetical protein n=1 Tax=Rickettsiales endosymbiont of Stachyamoeba lipophora TaxID=2486578 RepID=UPI000F6515EB|nr:hypothetical protein [Rickettsiales endosymbiont of Stachyamoeba lipophora]AZL15275.1 hypothetical protein EF513_01720 [Rickettsiales endosymbiont of Stachyamoeba lipophora]
MEEYKLACGLPRPIRKKIKVLFAILNYPNLEKRDKHLDYINFHRPLFENKLMKEVWEQLYKINPQNIVLFLEELMFIPEILKYEQERIAYVKAKKSIEKIKKYNYIIKAILKNLKNDKIGYFPETEFNQYYQEFNKGLLRYEENDSKILKSPRLIKVQSRGYPMLIPSSQKFIEEVFYIKIIYWLMKSMFRQPNYSYIIIIVNVLFPNYKNDGNENLDKNYIKAIVKDIDKIID